MLFCDNLRQQKLSMDKPGAASIGVGSQFISSKYPGSSSPTAHPLSVVFEFNSVHVSFDSSPIRPNRIHETVLSRSLVFLDSLLLEFLLEILLDWTGDFIEKYAWRVEHSEDFNRGNIF